MIRRIGIAFVFVMGFLILVAEVQRDDERADAELAAQQAPSTAERQR